MENLTTGIFMQIVLAAHTGMNRHIPQLLQKWFRVPHACGGEIVAVVLTMGQALSLRLKQKTFGYHMRTKFKVDLPTLMTVFNQATQRQTLAYLRVQPSEVRAVYQNDYFSTVILLNCFQEERPFQFGL
jgi:hypothetical protein